MRLTALAIALLLTATLLAGCTVKEGPITVGNQRNVPDSPSGTLPPGVTGKPTTSAPGGGVNQTGTLHGLRLVASSLQGAAPLNVTFQLDVDAGDENATWALDYGDGTSSSSTAARGFPATVVHIYATAGIVTAALTATFPDGTVRTTSLNLTVLTAGAAPPPTSGTAPVRMHSEGTIVVGTQGPESCGTAAEEGTDIVTLSFVVNTTASKVTRFYVNMTWGTPADLDIYLYDAAGVEVDRSAAGNTPVATPATAALEERIDIEGNFAVATYSIVILGCLGANVEFVVDAVALVA